MQNVLLHQGLRLDKKIALRKGNKKSGQRGRQRL
jgi:hypothetical protein